EHNGDLLSHAGVRWARDVGSPQAIDPRDGRKRALALRVRERWRADPTRPKMRVAGTWLAHSGVLQPGLDIEADDGPALLAAAKAQLDDGADLLKLYLDGPKKEEAPWSAEDVRAVVEMAHGRGAFVTAHSGFLTGARVGIDGGVDSLEHGFELDSDAVAAMARQKMFLVSTLAIFRSWASFSSTTTIPRFVSDDGKERIARRRERAIESVRLAHRAGVRIAAGTDFGGGSLRANHLAWEVESLVEAGLKPWEALASATVRGGELLDDPDAGRIFEGGPADFFPVDEEDIRGASLEDAACVGVVEEFPAADGRGGEGLPRLQSRLDERFDLPREVVGPEGSAAEVRPRRDPHAGAVGQADALNRSLPSSRDALLPVVADESRDRRGRGEGGPRAEDRQRADEEHLLAGHRRDRVGIELEAVLQRVDSAVDAHAGSRKEPGVRGHEGPSPVGHLHDRPHVLGGPRGLLLLGAVQVELEEVRAVVELRLGGCEEGRAVIRFDVEARLQHAAVRDPGARDPHLRAGRIGPPTFADPEGERSLATVPGVDRLRRPDVAGPTHARVGEEVAVVLRDLKQEGGSVEPAVDPMRPAGEGHVAVRVDHARDDRRSAGIDDAGVGVDDSLVRRRTNRKDPLAGHEDADALLERRARRVGEGRIPIKDGSRNRHPVGDGSSRISPRGFRG